MAQFVRLVKENPKQLSQYAAKAAVYRKFIETHIVPKWTDSKSHMGDCWVQLDAKTGYFKESEKMPGAFPKAKFDPLPYNQMAPYACMLWTMYDVNGNNAYRDKAGQMAQYLKDGMTINGDGYKWWYCNIPNPHMEDASHGNLDIDLAVESYNRGGAFKKEDMQRLANTLVEIMWNKSVESPQLSKTVDGTNKDPIYSANLNGWIRLTPFNKTVRIIAANYYKDFDLKGFNQAFSVARLVGAER